MRPRTGRGRRLETERREGELGHVGFLGDSSRITPSSAQLPRRSCSASAARYTL
jgi:hypothetical protein